MTVSTRRRAAGRPTAVRVHRPSRRGQPPLLCREQGSAAIETVVLVPAFLLFVLLIVYGGRLAVAKQAVGAAASEAARSASIARAVGQAQRDGAAGAAASLRSQDLACVAQQVLLDTTGFAAAVGTPAKVTATVTCVVEMSDLALPGVPGTRTITATMTSPIDTYRER